MSVTLRDSSVPRRRRSVVPSARRGFLAGSGTATANGHAPLAGREVWKTALDQQSQHERTLRLLQSRLEVLADVSERSISQPRPFDRRVLAVEAATRYAVALELVSREEASELWATVARRHPGVGWCQRGCPGLVA